VIGSRRYLLEMERSLVLIKPDAVRKNLIGEVIKRFEEDGLRVISLKMLWFSRKEVQMFYKEHEDKPFYDALSNYMSSGPIVALVLGGENVIKRTRELIGATDPSAADKGTIRADFGESITVNSVHGSANRESADTEISFMFSQIEIMDFNSGIYRR